jgi:organic hydroperoxide reductase OsmC/OhrA
VARKRGLDLLGLDVTTVGRYEGLKFGNISVSISSASPRSVVKDLLPEAKRVCYVTNTLQNQLEFTVEVK